MVQILTEHRRRLTSEALSKGKTMADWVFPSTAGTPLEPNRVREACFYALKKAGLRRIRFHDLRHSFASWLIANREPLKYIQEQLGHHSIQITADVYGHLIPGANRQAVNRLDDPLWKDEIGKATILMHQLSTSKSLNVLSEDNRATTHQRKRSM
jgi:integrase